MQIQQIIQYSTINIHLYINDQKERKTDSYLYISIVLFCVIVYVSDRAFAVVRVSATSSGTGTPGESPVKDDCHYHPCFY